MNLDFLIIFCTKWFVLKLKKSHSKFDKLFDENYSIFFFRMFNEDLRIAALSDFLPKTFDFKDNPLNPMYEDPFCSQSLKQNSSCSILSQSQGKATDIIASDHFLDKSNGDISNSDKDSNSKRKFFTEDEDQLLTMAAMAYKHESWNKISKFVPGRTPKQCRDRWVNYLQPSLKFDPWTDQEDQLLVSLVNSNGTHWTKMKAYFPSRSTNSLKNRWYWLLKNEVRTIPMDIISNSSLNNFSDIQKSGMQISTGQSGNIQNIFFGINNHNDNFQTDINNINSNSNDSNSNEMQQTENQNYYFWIKNKNKRKKCIKPTTKHVNKKNKRNIKETETSKYNLNQNLVKNKDDEVIAFNSEELNW